MNKLTIILPSLNVANYIHTCINSVLSQTLRDIEIICVDAGSTDGTLEILREYEKKDNRIKVIVSDIKSYGYQMNLGIQAANGKYIGIVETDDFVDKNMFYCLYALAEKYDVSMPIVDQVNEVLFEGKPAAEAVQELMLRDKTKEANTLTW